MKILQASILFYLLICGIIIVLPALQSEEYSLKDLTPDNYKYTEAETCSNCKEEQNKFMPRAAGVDISSGIPVLDKRGWLSSTHAISQSHGDRVNTACAWCHAPTTRAATKDKKSAKPIPKGTWQGVSCFACHPGSLERSQRKSLVINYTPGSDLSRPESYIFRDRADGRDMNEQCRFCHHEYHDLLIEEKRGMMVSGDLRCIDCHMAAYAVFEGHIERYHNFKVEENLPFSCSGGIGRTKTCHEGRSKDWFKHRLSEIKGPRKEW